MKQYTFYYSIFNWNLGTQISKYNMLNGARILEAGYTYASTFQNMPIAARQASHHSNRFSVHQSKGNIFTSPLKHFCRSFLSPRINCGKPTSHLGSEQRFIVNCSKLLFQFSITSDLKRKSMVPQHTPRMMIIILFLQDKSYLQPVVRFKTKQVLVPTTAV